MVKNEIRIEDTIDDVPGMEAIKILVDLQKDFGSGLVFVQRSLGQKRSWREIGLFLDEAPHVKSTFWQGLIALGKCPSTP